MSEFQPLECHHQGAVLTGQIISPSATGKHPGVLVMSSATGMGNYYLAYARRLAELGYVALATDMYGGSAYFPIPEEASPVYFPLLKAPDLLRSRVVAWFKTLRAQAHVDPDRIAAIGYCFGGQCVLELARSGADVKAVVSFHGQLDTKLPAAPGAVKGVVAVHTGAEDPYAPQATVDEFVTEMKHAGVNYHLTIFSDACHAFTTKELDKLPVPGLAYNPIADAVSWAAMTALLGQVFAG